MYQWDVNQRLVLYEVNAGEEVHYAHRNDENDNALVVKTYSENNKIYANIPNILLQTAGDMDVYVYVTVGNDQHTEKRFILRVEQREKPSDYVYTETEILTWKSLDERITELEKGGTGGSDAVKYTEQELTDEQKTQARANIGAVSAGEVPEQVQADWNQNNESAVDFVKNRTHYEEVAFTELIPETTVTIEGDYGSAEFQIDQQLVEGETYFVTLNGTNYECVARYVIDDDNYVLIGNGTIFGDGNEGNGEPFSCDSYESGIIYLNAATAGEYTFSITHSTTVVHKIDEKYIPESVLVQTDWNQTDDTETDYLKNKPFGGLPEDLGTYNFTAISETTIDYVTAENDGSFDVCRHLFNHMDILNATQVVINGETDLWTSKFDRGYLSARGDKFSLYTFYNAGETVTITSNTDIFTTGNTYPVLFQGVSDEYIKKIDLRYIPNSVYTSENAPVKFGSGTKSSIQGFNTIASGEYSHAEGSGTTASGNNSHAEGADTTASGLYSHAEGLHTTASGNFSHAEGNYTTASGRYSHAQGKFNVEDSSGVYAHIVGNGEGDGNRRSNAHALDWNGNAYYKGNVFVKGTNPDASGGQEVATKSGWTANKYIGTDENGNLVEKDAPAGGGGDGVSIDDTLTISGAAADAKATGDQIRALSEEIANGGGLTTEEKSLMLSLFNNALYGADVGAIKNRLNDLWGGESGGDSGGDSGDSTLYTISTNFVNVSIDNTATSVTANSAFNATLTPTAGELASVTITMGGVDVTADVYADGVITIPAVTGNIVITASASA